jgi:hypothetical protein
MGEEGLEGGKAGGSPQVLDNVGGVPCVHPVQVYVDLKDQPERASEAAEHLRANPILLGGANAKS